MRFGIIALNVVTSKKTGDRYLIFASRNSDGSYSTQYKGSDGVYRSRMVKVSQDIADMIRPGEYYTIQIKNGELISIDYL